MYHFVSLIQIKNIFIFTFIFYDYFFLLIFFFLLLLLVCDYILSPIWLYVWCHGIVKWGQVFILCIVRVIFTMLWSSASKYLIATPMGVPIGGGCLVMAQAVL